MKKGRVKKVIAAVVLFLLLYVIAGAVIPFIIQPEITQETEETVRNTGFTGEEACGERVCVLSENGEALGHLRQRAGCCYDDKFDCQ